MSITFEPVTSDFAAVVSGIDLRQPLAAADRDRIVELCDKFGILLFQDQHLSKEELVAFGAHFGELDTSLQRKLMHRIQNRLGLDMVTDISNVDAEGKVADRAHWQTITTVGNRFWHTDGSFKHYPNRYSLLNCVVPVTYGGETQYADLRAAYDALDDVTKKLISDKIAIFYSHNTREWLHVKDSVDEKQAYPRARWPMVRTHPGSGRKVLWCDSKVCAIEGMLEPEGRALAFELIEHIGQRERVYSHKWKSGDLVFCDNRAALHRGRRFNMEERREMRRVEVLDDVHSLGVIEYEQAQAKSA